MRLSCTWIDTGLRNPYGVGNFLQVNYQKLNGETKNQATKRHISKFWVVFTLSSVVGNSLAKS